MFTCDSYRDQLAIAHPRFGHALWCPGTPEHHPPVEVGDVGFVHLGLFLRLFNALLPEDHPTNARLGVPENYEPFQPLERDHIDRETFQPRNICSNGVVAIPGRTEVSEAGSSFETSFSFTKKQGSALSLPLASQRQDTLLQDKFRQWIIAHIDSWFAFSQFHWTGAKMEDIVLVTGCHRTRAWANFTSDRAQAGSRLTLGVGITNAGANLHWGVLYDDTKGMLNIRPTDHPPANSKVPPENDCVFIRGFRVQRKFFGMVQRIRGAAEPKPDPRRDDRGPEVEAVPKSITSEYKDPLHQLLNHIAKRAPDCDMVLVHDDDLEQVLPVNDGTPLKTLQLMDHLERLKPKIGVMSDTFSSSDGTVTQHKKVAMLFKQLHSSDTPAPFPLPSHIPGGTTITEERTVQHPVLRATTGHQLELDDLNPGVQVLPSVRLCA